MTREIATPLGPMTAAATAGGVCVLEFPGVRTARALAAVGVAGDAGVGTRAGSPDADDDADAAAAAAHLDRLAAELDAYFAGRLTRFAVPLDLAAGPASAFELAVWRALTEIPRGSTESYGGLAARLGRPGAARAVGLANGRNRVAIVVPCHRVIGGDGRLTGYGGGLERKRRLLELEGAIEPEPALFAPTD